MKTNQLFFLLALPFLLSSCATVFGGRKYNAMVKVEDNSQAEIYYNGQKIGTGSGSVQVPRSQANKLVFKLKQDGCPDQDIRFHSRQTRGWALAGSIVSDILLFPFVINNVVDIATGAYFKPYDGNPSIIQLSDDIFSYQLEYTSCPTEPSRGTPIQVNSRETVSPQLAKSKKEKLIELDELFKEGMISEEEYKESRKQVLAQ
ncbi:MAG: SHOCT domain-containing protein [Vicingaceae bacterium]